MTKASGDNLGIMRIIKKARTTRHVNKCPSNEYRAIPAAPHQHYRIYYTKMSKPPCLSHLIDIRKNIISLNKVGVGIPRDILTR